MENKLIHGDCLVELRKLEDNNVDYIITDPPYNLGKADWDNGVLDLLDITAKECSRVLKEEGIMVWFVPTRLLFKIGNLIQQYIPYRWSFVWNTPNNMLNGDIGFSKYTSILIFSRAKSVYRNMQDLKSISWRPTKIDHPTPKPIALMRYLVGKFSKEGDVILDCFAGSGTTLLACKQLNRVYIGIEKEEKYIKVIKHRLAQTTL